MSVCSGYHDDPSVQLEHMHLVLHLEQQDQGGFSAVYLLIIG